MSHRARQSMQINKQKLVELQYGRNDLETVLKSFK